MEKTPSKLVDSLSQMEKSSALLLRPKRRSTAKQTVKACAAQQGVDHIDTFQVGEVGAPEEQVSAIINSSKQNLFVKEKAI